MIKVLLEKYPAVLSYFLSCIPAAIFEKRGLQSALRTARLASKKVPAYKSYLTNSKMNGAEIKNQEDFERLPLTDKANYFQYFPLEDVCQNGTLEDKYLIDGSSGYGGERSYWPRLTREDDNYPLFMELTYRQFFKIHKRSTLMIVTLGLGVWIAGEKVSWASRQIAMKGKYKMTVMSPGMQPDEVLDIVKKLGHFYDQVVIIGYPLSVSRIIDQGDKSGIDWPALNVKLGLGGEGFTEGWREQMSQQIGLRKDDLIGIGSAYAAAELGMAVGRETPLSVLFRKLAYEDKALAEDLFGQWNPLPSFCQYNPSSFYIEEINGELIFTANNAVPVIRYNIHDRGGVIPYNKVLDIISDHDYKPIQMLASYGYKKTDIWHMPFFYVWGRSGTAGSLSIFGLIIYSESIKVALEQPHIANKNTGNFKMESVPDDNHNPVLQIKIELALGVNPSREIENEMVTSITETLEKQNNEYVDLRHAMKDKVLPHVLLYPYQDPEIYVSEAIKQNYTVKE
jgi:phenylacetate-CoA ligase